MSSNYTLISIATFNITKDKSNWSHWSLMYDTKIIYNGLRNFSTRYANIKYMFIDYGIKKFENNWHNIFWDENYLCNDKIGLIIRGLKCYKKIKQKDQYKSYIIEKDLVNDLVRLI